LQSGAKIGAFPQNQRALKGDSMKTRLVDKLRELIDEASDELAFDKFDREAVSEILHTALKLLETEAK
jgi:hypothetical protein